MYFYYETDIPPSTLDNEAIEQVLQLSKGYAAYIEIGFPKGVQRLAKCRVLYNTFQLVPFNRDGWLSGEDVLLHIPLELELDEPPYIFTVQCINYDDTFLHQLSFGVSIDTGKIEGLAALQALVNPVQAPQEG